MNPYRVILGDAWDELAPGVRMAHSPPLKATGELHVRVSKVARRFLALPPNGEAVRTTLELRFEGDRVRWIRSFGDWGAESLQSFTSDGFVEDAGPSRLQMRLEATGRSIAHRFVKSRMFGVPVPRFLGPVANGTVSEGPTDSSWHIAIEISHQWFGTICSYEGVMHAE